jgi:alkylhydroperoxidase/carboxymuconolactone decarboxylase family protein YurZ
MPADLRLHFQLARDVHCGSEADLAQSAEALAQEFGSTELREVLRLLHLFFGFPPLVRAWNAALPSLESETHRKAFDPTLQAAHSADSIELGLKTFQHLYGEQSERVLHHLQRLDPLLHRWILGHAYGSVLSRPHLSVASKERVAILCLAATQCWQQWQSHVLIALRHGVPLQTMRADLREIAWLDEQSLSLAEQKLASA